MLPPFLRNILSGTFIEEANNLRFINSDCTFHCLKLISKIHIQNMQMKFTSSEVIFRKINTFFSKHLLHEKRRVAWEFHQSIFIFTSSQILVDVEEQREIWIVDLFIYYEYFRFRLCLCTLSIQFAQRNIYNSNTTKSSQEYSITIKLLSPFNRGCSLCGCLISCCD